MLSNDEVARIYQGKLEEVRELEKQIEALLQRKSAKEKELTELRDRYSTTIGRAVPNDVQAFDQDPHQAQKK